MADDDLREVAQALIDKGFKPEDVAALNPADRQKLIDGYRQIKQQKAASVVDPYKNRPRKSAAQIQGEAQRLQSPVTDPSLMGEVGASAKEWAKNTGGALLNLPKDIATAPLAITEAFSHPGEAAASALRGITAGLSDHAMGAVVGATPEEISGFREESRQVAPHSEFVGAVASPINRVGPVAGPTLQSGISAVSEGGDLADVAQAMGTGAALGAVTHGGARLAAPVVRRAADKAIETFTPKAAKAIELGERHGAKPTIGGLRGGPFAKGGELHGVDPTDVNVGRVATEQASRIDNTIRHRVSREGANVGAEEARARAMVTGPVVPTDVLRARLQRYVDKGKPGPWRELLARLDGIEHRPGAAEPAPVSATAETMLAEVPARGDGGGRRQTAITRPLPVSERAGQRAPGVPSRLATLEDIDTFIEAIDDADPFNKGLTEVKDRNLQGIRRLANEARGSIDHPVAQDLADARTRYHQAKKDASLQRNAMGQRFEADDTGSARANLANKLSRMGTDSVAEGKQQPNIDLLRLYGHGPQLDLPELLRRQGQIQPGLALNPLTLAAKNANALSALVINPLTRDVSRPVPSLTGAASAEASRKRKRRQR